MLLLSEPLAKSLQPTDKPLMAFVLVCLQSLGSTNTFTYFKKHLLWLITLLLSRWFMPFRHSQKALFLCCSLFLSYHSQCPLIYLLITINTPRLLIPHHTNRVKWLRFKIRRPVRIETSTTATTGNIWHCYFVLFLKADTAAL